MSEFKIEKNIPIPQGGRREAQGRAATLKRMQIGDSILVSKRDEVNALYVEARRQGIKLTARTVKDGIRVWRIEPTAGGGES